jgi:hypothetical protein
MEKIRNIPSNQSLAQPGLMEAHAVSRAPCGSSPPFPSFSILLFFE